MDRAKADLVLNELRSGQSLRSAAAKAGIAASTVLDWAGRFPDFGEQYARAREIGYALLADQIIELSDNPAGGITSEGVQHARLQVDSRKWMLAKMLPKVYGDKQEHQVNGGITINLSRVENDL